MIWPTETLYIGLIQDDVNVVATHREPQVEVPHMGAYFIDVVEKMHSDVPPLHPTWMMTFFS